MTKKEQVKEVIGQVINMYINNVLNDWGNECFLGWINEGEVWSDRIPQDSKDNEELLQIAEFIAPEIDAITQKIEDLKEEDLYTNF